VLRGNSNCGMKSFLFYSKPLNVIFGGLLLFLILVSCSVTDTKEQDSNFTRIVPSQINEIGYEVTQDVTIEETELAFDNDLYQYHNNHNSISIYDKKHDKYIHFNYKGELINYYDENSFYQIPFTPTSIYYSNKKTTFLFLHQLQIGQLESDSLSQIVLSEEPSGSRYSDRNRFEVLPNGNFLLAPAVNVLSNTSYYNQILNKDLTDVLSQQYLFTIYDSLGHMINKFGNFPQSNFVKNPRLYINPYYFYVIKGGFMYVAFPMGKELLKFSLNGELVEKFLIDLPGFDYETKENEIGSDTMAGLGIEKNSQDDILYFHTILSNDENRIKHKLFRLNMRTKTLDYSEIMNGNNYMLPYIYDGQVSFLKKYIRKEEKDIYRLKLTSESNE
jgi:hypothetical protein